MVTVFGANDKRVIINGTITMLHFEYIVCIKQSIYYCLLAVANPSLTSTSKLGLSECY